MKNCFSMLIIMSTLLLSGCSHLNSSMLPIDFKTQRMPDKPNYYLVCPNHYCAASADEISPVYSVSAEKLAGNWALVIQKQPRWTIAYQNMSTYHYVYIQRSKIFRFPDIIDVEILSLGENKSSIAIFSRAKYGYYDMGVNKNRVKLLLNQLTNQVSSSH